MFRKIEENKDKICQLIKYHNFQVKYISCVHIIICALTNMFGDVVYLDKPVSSVDEAKSVQRTAKAEVVKKIYADFDKSAELLAASSVKTLGRVTGALQCLTKHGQLCKTTIGQRLLLLQNQ
jgi:hypothetical protein